MIKLNERLLNEGSNARSNIRSSNVRLLNEKSLRYKIIEWKIKYKIEYEIIEYNERLSNIGSLNTIKDRWIQDYQI